MSDQEYEIAELERKNRQLESELDDERSNRRRNESELRQTLSDCDDHLTGLYERIEELEAHNAAFRILFLNRDGISSQEWEDTLSKCRKE